MTEAVADALQRAELRLMERAELGVASESSMGALGSMAASMAEVGVSDGLWWGLWGPMWWVVMGPFKNCLYIYIYTQKKCAPKEACFFSFFGTFFGGVYGGWTYTILINSLLEGWVSGALIGSDQGVFFFFFGGVGVRFRTFLLRLFSRMAYWNASDGWYLHIWLV